MARKKKVSMQDIADRLQISKNAVSLALLNKKGVSEEMRSRIVQTAREMGYGPFADKTPASGNILVLVPERIMSYQDNDHFQFYHDMIWGLEKSIRARGLNAVVVPIGREMELRLELPRHCSEIAYLGIVLFGIVDEAYARVVWELDVPLVMLDSYHRGLPCPVVASANIEGADEAVSMLIRLGHRDIGFIGPANLTTSHEERWYGYWRAMQAHGIGIRDDYILTSSRSFDYTEQEIGVFLDGMKRKPSAFFCGNDRIAYLLARQLGKRDIRVPDDISVVGFDGLRYEDENGLQMTTMRVEKAKMADAATSLLLSVAGEGGLREAIRVHVAPTLVTGNSVRERPE
ncbi:LacI family DNA-binding transcriptional regulator [Paenibacillus sp. M1]|uniref:LacI family DNA-binding transcriptional regulator n=1 Tax=Paenibacillus haidiansis TaxID=1574488 RepID=A0ABU7VMM5_9BACL